MSKNLAPALPLVLIGALSALPAVTACSSSTERTESSESQNNGEATENESPGTAEQTGSSSIVAPAQTVNPDSFPDMTAEGFAQMLALEAGMRKLVEAEILASIAISDKEKQEFYQENTEKMKSPEQLRLSHILVKAPQGDASARAAARKKTEDLQVRLNAGEDFATLASQNSDDPGSKGNGGELPWVSRGDTVPAFEQAAFALSPGETTEIVQTRFGYHIIKLSERKPKQPLPYDDAVGRIEEFLTQQAVQEQIQNRVEALKSEAQVEIFI